MARPVFLQINGKTVLKATINGKVWYVSEPYENPEIVFSFKDIDGNDIDFEEIVNDYSKNYNINTNTDFFKGYIIVNKELSKGFLGFDSKYISINTNDSYVCDIKVVNDNTLYVVISTLNGDIRYIDIDVTSYKQYIQQHISLGFDTDSFDKVLPKPIYYNNLHYNYYPSTNIVVPIIDLKLNEKLLLHFKHEYDYITYYHEKQQLNFENIGGASVIRSVYMHNGLIVADYGSSYDTSFKITIPCPDGYTWDDGTNNDLVFICYLLREGSEIPDPPGENEGTEIPVPPGEDDGEDTGGTTTDTPTSVQIIGTDYLGTRVENDIIEFNITVTYHSVYEDGRTTNTLQQSFGDMLSEGTKFKYTITDEWGNSVADDIVIYEGSN